MALPWVQECAAILDRLAPHLLRAAVGSAVVIGLAALATLTMRRASAAARHGVWLAGAAGMLLLPALSAALPGWHALPRAAAGRAQTIIHVSGLTEHDDAISLPAAPALQPLQSPRSPVAASARNRATAINIDSESLAADSPPAAITSAGAAQANPERAPTPQQKLAAVEQPQRLPWKALLVLCWALGSLLLMVRLLLGYVSLWLLRRRCVVISHGDIFDLLQRLRHELKLRGRIELLQSPARSMPMTWGLWRARLLLPQEADQWPAGQRRDVLLHELGHLKRGDCLSQLLSQIACSLYWFNPLAWVADRRMQVERERACDDLVISNGADARSYARHLLESISLSSFPAFRLASAAMAMARPSTLEERMRAILDARVSRRGTTARYRAATIILLLAALVPVAVLKAQAPQLPAGQEPPTNSGAAPATGRGAQPPTTRPAPQRDARGFGGLGGVGEPAAPVLGEGPTCHFDATIYDVRMPIEKIGKVSVAALDSAAQTAESFEKALAALGSPAPIYRADESVRLSSDVINIGSRTPYVSNTRVGADGQNIDTFSYVSTGAIFMLAGKAGAPDRIDFDLSIQLSSLADSAVGIGNAGDKLMPIIHTFVLQRKGPIRPGKPFVFLTVDGASLDKDGNAVAYIARVTVGEPQPAR